MADYDFQGLSSHDFELLVRDLLQEELQTRLESFAKGRDSGIDFRFRSPNGDLVVQCKHYRDYEELYRILARDEVPKVQRLKPKRYILAVSTPLTPHRKDQMLKLFAPYCLGTSDIFGREDLNNLLGIHANVERRHIKLWLTSETVLTRVLQGGIWADSELTLERIRNRTSRYVPNPSLGRAREILEKHHYCIIAGIPGIGKTTLAEILLIDFVDRHGFQAIRIANDLSEIKAVKNANNLQIFYFDDFLGKTALDKLQKNEDQRLTEFIQDVGANNNWRFVLTTREYILNAAMMRYESLANPAANFSLCMVNLSDYTYPIRARILYNHIYFSDLPKEYKRALLENHRYKKILLHENYNPRIIDHMTQARNVQTMPVTGYFESFIKNLQNPIRIWDHAFRNQLSEAAQHVLLVMGSMPEEVLVADLEIAFNQFYQYRRSRLGFSTSSRDFERALKELDGNFIKTTLVGTDQIVEFHNPSVSDFIEYYLAESPSEVADLMEATSFFDQFVRLWRGQGGKRFTGIDKHADYFVQALGRKISAPECELVRYADGKGEIAGVRRVVTSFEARVLFAAELINELATPGARDVLEQLLVALRRRVETRQGHKRDLVRLVRKLIPADSNRGPQDEVLVAAKMYLVHTLQEFDDFKNVGQFVESYPHMFSPDELTRIREIFTRFCEDYDPTWEDDPEWIESFADEVERVGLQLDVEVGSFCQALLESAGELRANREERDYEPNDPDEDWADRGSATAENTDEMFENLLQEIDEKG